KMVFAGRRLALVAAFAFMAALGLSRVDFSLVRKSYISAHTLQQFGAMAYAVHEVDGFIENLQLLRNLETLPKDDMREFLRGLRANDGRIAVGSARRPNVVILQMESIEANALNAKLDDGYAM